MKNGTKAYRGQCIPCSNVNSRKDYYRRDSSAHAKTQHRGHIQRTFGLSEGEYDALFQSQSGVCAVCGKPEVTRSKRGVRHNLAVDHDHTTGKVRALLCKRCNTGIGQFSDDPGLVLAAFKYLTEHTN